MKTHVLVVLFFPLVAALQACTETAVPGTTVETPDEADAPESSPTHLGGCILTSPIGEVPADVYRQTGITPSEKYAPFTKQMTVYGLTLVARDEASDAFMQNVATAIKEVFPRNEDLDLDKQEEILKNHYRYRALIPVPVGEDMSFLDQDEAARDRIMADNSVCDIIMEGVDGQVMEVVEHILHYVSDVGLHYTYPEDWGISQSSAVNQAMLKAVDEGFYDIDSYNDIDEGEVRHRVALQEFAYWFISTAWDLQEPYGPNENEWTIRNREELSEKLPEFYAVYERTVGRTMVPPSLATLQDIGPTRAEERAR